MSERDLEWRPGSFSKQFSWGQAAGLGHLRNVIRSGFDQRLMPVERDVFRERVRPLAGDRDLIPSNFFLFNYVAQAKSWLAVDELVFVALTRDHEQTFDRLAVFALNFSKVGVWRGADSSQRYPALWAKYYIIDEIAGADGWRSDQIDADRIEAYFRENMTYGSKSPRKFATNLNDIYRRAAVEGMRTAAHEKWWGHAVFLALDRIVMDEAPDSIPTTSELLSKLSDSEFWRLTAISEEEGRVAAGELLEFYRDLGGPRRFHNAEPLAPAVDEVSAVRQRAILQAASQSIDLPPVARTFVQAQRQCRDRNLVLYLKQMYEDQCSACGDALMLSADRRYSEAGHVWPLGSPFNGPDHLSNMLIFCPNHHKAFDHGAMLLIDAGGRLRVKSKTGDQRVAGREFTPKAEHGLHSDFLTKHRKHFEID